jgi:tetratricopeptide (TPR) repeat protein
MKRIWMPCVAATCFALLTAGSCSRARVESMNLMNQGVIAAQQKQYIEAVAKLEQASAVDPTNHEALWNLAIVHMEMQKFEAARDDLQKAIAASPETAGYHYKLGEVLIELRDWNGAKVALEKAIERDPQLFKAYYKLGRVHEQLALGDDGVGHLQEALKRYTEAVQKGPRFLEAYNALGRLYADLGYLDQAVQVLKAAQQVALAGTEEAASAHALLASVYQQQNKIDDAIREYRAALDIVPGMPDALFSLGWTYAQQGNREEARRFLKKYVDVASANQPQHYVKAARDRLNEISEGH